VRNYIAGNLSTLLERYTTVAILITLFLFQAFSGCIIWFVLPRGALDYENMLYGSGRNFLELQRNVWSDLHAWVAIAALAIMIIHIVIHWRWIKNVTLGNRLRTKTSLNGNDNTEHTSNRLMSAEKEPAEQSYTGKKDKQYMQQIRKTQSPISRIGTFVGLFGGISLTVFIAIFMLDWVGRYDLLLILVPFPFITLFLAQKKPIIGGILLIVFGIFADVLDIYATIGVVGYISGLGLGYTLFFVTFPLITSGMLSLLSIRNIAKK